jgi:F420-dependent oxidoreductase-like protein
MPDTGVPEPGRELTPEPVQLPAPCVVVLVGPGASGKSSFAAAHFPPDTVVSSDRLRAVVGSGEDDMSASDDAFFLLEAIVERRFARRLTTVIDTLGFEDGRRAAWLGAARRAGMPCVAVTFDTPATECRSRNAARPRRIPAAVLTAQLSRWRELRDRIGSEGFDLVIAAAPLRLVPEAFATAAQAARRQHEQPAGLRFGLHLGQFAFPGGPDATRSAIAEIGRAAESAGFHALYVMDHFRQIPQIGRPFEDFLESYATLSYLAACTEKVRLGTLVTSVTYRNPAHLGKIVATLDVLSGGRAVCGIGLGWFKDEHTAYGFELPGIGERYQLLEDALRLLPLLWGSGSPPFEGRRLRVPEAMCYPRPLQEHVPIVLGGGGERRTLRLAARYADAANVMGDMATVRRKAEVLRAHCEDVGRDPNQVELTHLSSLLVGSDDAHVSELLGRLPPRSRVGAARRGRTSGLAAGTVGDHIGRCRELAEAGVAEVVVRLPDPLDASSMEQMSKVIAAFA